MLAAVLKTPEMALADSEAHQLAVAAEHLAGFYNTQISPKALAWYGMTQALAVVYAPRMVVMYANGKANRQRKRDERILRTPQPVRQSGPTQDSPAMRPAPTPGPRPQDPPRAPVNPIGMLPSDLNVYEDAA